MSLPPVPVTWDLVESKTLHGSLLSGGRHPSLLIITDGADASAPSTFLGATYLGNQFLFPFFPITRLYFENGVNASLAELLADEAQGRGFDVYMTSKNSFPEATQIFHPSVAVAPSFQSPSLNVYDLFFFRIWSLSGDFTLATLSSGCESMTPLSPLALERKHISEQKVARAGFAHELSDFFSRTLRQEVMSLLTALLAHPHSEPHATSCTTASRPLVFILSPTIDPALFPITGPSTSETKVISQLMPIRREILMHTAKQLDHSGIAYAYAPLSREPNIPEGAWLFQSEFLRTQDEKPRIAIRLRLLSSGPSASSVTQAATCKTKIEAEQSIAVLSNSAEFQTALQKSLEHFFFSKTQVTNDKNTNENTEQELTCEFRSS